LLHPIVINENNELVAGQRRLEACKTLGWIKIACRVVNISDIIKGEFIENIARKDFTFSERQAILQEIESKRIGHRVSKESSANLQTFQRDNKGKPSVNIVADYTGLSPRQLSNEKDVYMHAKSNPQEFGYLIKELDNGDITVNAALSKIHVHLDEKRKLEQAAIVKKRRQEQKQKRQESGYMSPKQKEIEELKYSRDLAIDQQIRLSQEVQKLEQNQQHKKSIIQRSSSQSSQPQPDQQIDNLGDYDPTKRDRYDRQTLYKVIDWLFEQNHMLREANRNLRQLPRESV
jgi:ParB family transcriptional regulator, chromosome partitioning protein